MKKILILTHRAIGDVIFQIPLIKALSKNSELIIIARKTNKADLLLENFQNIKVVYLDFYYERKVISKIKFFFKLIKLINSFNAKEVYSLTLSSPIILPIIFSKPKTKLPTNFFQSKVNRKGFNSLKPSQITLNFMKENSLRYENFHLDLNTDKHNTIINNFKNCKKPWIFFSIDSFHNAPNWDVKNFKFLIEKATEKFETIFVNTLPAHKDIFFNLNLDQSYKKKVLDTSIYPWREIMSFIRNSDLFIGNHSGPGHMADAMNVRTIIINNNTHDNALWSEESSFLGKDSIYFNTWETENSKILDFILNEYKKI